MEMGPMVIYWFRGRFGECGRWRG